MSDAVDLVTVNESQRCCSNFWKGSAKCYVYNCRHLPFENANRDVAQTALIQTLKVGDYPLGLAFDGENLWVLNERDDTVMKLRPSDEEAKSSDFVRFHALSFISSLRQIARKTAPDFLLPLTNRLPKIRP